MYNRVCDVNKQIPFFKDVCVFIQQCSFMQQGWLYCFFPFASNSVLELYQLLETTLQHRSTNKTDTDCTLFLPAVVCCEVCNEALELSEVSH